MSDVKINRGEMTMTLSINDLRNAFKNNQNDGGGNSRPNNYYPFWNMNDGSQAIVRFLPDADKNNPMGFMVEKLMHTLTINGENKSVPCLRMYGEDCPICKASSAFYKQDDRANGKKYWRKKQHIAQALIVEDALDPDPESGETHEGTVRFLALGFQIFNVIKDTFESGELEEVPFAYENGTNFAIKKTRQGEYPSYSLSKFVRSPSDLTEDQIAYVQDQLIDLKTLLPQHPGTEKVEAMLEAALTGGEYQSDEDTGLTLPKRAKTESFDDEEEKHTAEVSNTSSVEESSDDEFEEEADKILAQIRNRRKNK